MKTALFAISIVVGAALTAGMCVDAYKQFKHDTALVAAKVEAYTEGRTQAIDDITNPKAKTATTTTTSTK